MKEEKDIDRLFRDGLESPNIPFDELDWKDMDQRLHPQRKNKIVPIGWYAVVAGIAAMLLLIFFITKQEINHDEQLYSRKKGLDSIGTKTPNEMVKESVHKIVLPPSIHNKQIDTISGQPNSRYLALANLPRLAQSLRIVNTIKAVSAGSIEGINKYKPLELPSRTLLPIVFSPTTRSAIKADKKPRIVLGISATPDLTTVKGSGSSNLSGGLGLEASVFLNKKMSITTGVAYAKKIYDSDFSLYHPKTDYLFRNDPTNVKANCDVLDIPLNINYTVLENYKGSITISTGLSSYLMLKEKYNYSYHTGIQGPKSYQVINQNQHLLAIANIGVEFQHKINHKLSLSAKPFAKIPLTDIGYGNVKLSSIGISLTANMDLLRKK